MNRLIVLLVGVSLACLCAAYAAPKSKAPAKIKVVDERAAYLKKLDALMKNWRSAKNSLDEMRAADVPPHDSKIRISRLRRCSAALRNITPVPKSLAKLDGLLTEYSKQLDRVCYAAEVYLRKSAGTEEERDDGYLYLAEEYSKARDLYLKFESEWRMATEPGVKAKKYVDG